MSSWRNCWKKREEQKIFPISAVKLRKLALQQLEDWKQQDQSWVIVVACCEEKSEWSSPSFF